MLRFLSSALPLPLGDCLALTVSVMSFCCQEEGGIQEWDKESRRGGQSGGSPAREVAPHPGPVCTGSHPALGPGAREEQVPEPPGRGLRERGGLSGPRRACLSAAGPSSLLSGADGCGLEVTWGLEEVAGGSSALAGDAEKLGPSGLVGTGALRPCSAVPGPRAWPATSVTLRGRSSAPADSWAALDEPESSRSPLATMRVAGAPCGLDAEGGLD